MSVLLLCALMSTSDFSNFFKWSIKIDIKDSQGKILSKRTNYNPCESVAESVAKSDVVTYHVDDTLNWEPEEHLSSTPPTENLDYNSDLDPKWAWHHDSSTGLKLVLSQWTFLLTCALAARQLLKCF